jgi:hypothetical protein
MSSNDTYKYKILFIKLQFRLEQLSPFTPKNYALTNHLQKSVFEKEYILIGNVYFP